jgi:hypothetical protein
MEINVTYTDSAENILNVSFITSDDFSIQIGESESVIIPRKDMKKIMLLIESMIIASE